MEIRNKLSRILLLSALLFLLIFMVGFLQVSAQGSANIVIFDFTDLLNLKLLGNYVITGTGTALAFIVLYHVAMKNDGFSKRDMFFLLAGPSTGFLLAIMGAPQMDVIQWTFTINLGLTGAKDGLTKLAEYGKKKE